MRRRGWGFFATATASGCLALLAAQGCNVLLGNHEATLAEASAAEAKAPTPDAPTPDVRTRDAKMRAPDVAPKDAGGEATTDAPPPCPSPDASLANDPHNCDRCGHDCLGGECVSGLCQPTKIFTDLGGVDPIVAIATDGIWVYWGNYAAVFFGPVAGGKVGALASTGVPAGGTIAVGDGSVYWTTATRLLSCPQPPATCLAPVSIESAPSSVLPLGLALDSKEFYFSIGEADSGVFACPQGSLCDGGALLVAAVDYAGQVAVAPRHVLWTALGRGPYDLVDGGVTNLAPDGGALGRLVASTTTAYWSENDALWSCILGACDAGLAVTVDAGWILALAADPTSAYFTDTTGELWAYSSGKGPMRLAVDGGTAMNAVAVDAQAIYWSEYDFSTFSASIVKLARP